MQKPSLSIVIPAYNEEEYIGACLRALAAQETSRPYEVILVDNNSTDKTRSLAGRYEDVLTLRIVSETKRCRGSARKRGFAAAKGDIILSTDADVIVPPDWIESMAAALESGRGVAVVGVYAINDQGYLVNFIHNIWIHLWAPFCRLLCGHFLFRGSNFGIWRTAYLAAGGFNERADAAEDAELSCRVYAIGKISYLPGMCVIASGRRLEKSFIAGTLQYLTVFKRLFFGRNQTSFSSIR